MGPVASHPDRDRLIHMRLPTWLRADRRRGGLRPRGGSHGWRVAGAGGGHGRQGSRGGHRWL